MPVGTASTDTAIFTSVKTLVNNTTRIYNSPTDLGITAASAVTLTATEVDLTSSVFTSSLATLPRVAVAGSTTLAATSASTATADTIVTKTVQSALPGDTMTVTASKVFLNADVQTTGKITATNNNELDLIDTIISPGSTSSTADATRDGAGFVIPGAPAHAPNGTDAALYEHSIKWKVYDGDFNVDGTRTAPHRRPAWEVSGGVGISAPNSLNPLAPSAALFYFAPYFTATTASLGLYYSNGGDTVMIENFSAAAAP